MNITFIVPFGREGAADRAAHAATLALADRPGEGSIVIENLPGEGGLRGVERANELARRADPVLLLGTPTTHVLLPARLGPSAAPDDRFVPILGLGSVPNVLLASPTLNISTVAQLIARARETELVYASAGTGQTIHVCTALFCQQAGIHMRHLPYDGGSATVYPDLVAGRVQVYFDSLLGSVTQIAEGDAIPLAVSSRRRNPLLAMIPTLDECGFDHALDVWLGVFGAGVAEEGASRNAELRGLLPGLGLSGGPLSGADLAGVVAQSVPMWQRAYRTTEEDGHA